MHDRDPGGQGSKLPPPIPPKPRARHRYSPDHWRDGENYLSWSPEWTARGLTRHPPGDRSNRVAPWGYHDGLPLAPWGVSPVSGCPRLSPPTVGPLKSRHLNAQRDRSDAAYPASVARAIGESLERRLAELLGSDLLKPMTDIINDPAASRVERIMAWRAVMPFVIPRRKSVEVTSKKEVTNHYVISIPAAPDASPILEIEQDD